MAATPTTERRSRTERERAEDALGIAQRKVDKLRAAVTDHEKALKAAKADLVDAQRLLAYRADHPALPSRPETVAAAPATHEEETTK